MNWYKKAKHRGAKEEKSIWYHGTKGRNLSSILSQGLVSDPKEKAWAEDPGASFNSPSRVSLGGIYLTQNLMTARISAYKNKNKNEDMILVIVEAQPRSLIMDEDDISYMVRDAIRNESYISTEYNVGDIYMANKLGTNKEYLSSIKQKYAQNIIKDIKFHYGELTPELEQRIYDIVMASWEISLNRQAAYIKDHYPDRMRIELFERNLSQDQHKELERKKREILSQPNKSDDEKWDEYLKYLTFVAPDFPNKTNSEQQYASYLDRLTKTLKNYARPLKSKESFNPKARSLRSIGYHGENKIICIVKETPEREVEIVYGTPPEEFINAWEKNVGKFNPKYNNQKAASYKCWMKKAQINISNKTTQDIDQLTQLATQFRQQMVKCYDDECLKSLCLQVSRKLRDFLISKGFNTAIVVQGVFRVDNPDPEAYADWDPDDFENEEEMESATYTPLHYWIEVQDFIVDITADQFNDELDDPVDPVEIGTYYELERYTAIHKDWA